MKITEKQMNILVGILAAMVSGILVAFGFPVSLILLAGVGYLVFVFHVDVKEIGLGIVEKAKHKHKKLKDKCKAKKEEKK